MGDKTDLRTEAKARLASALASAEVYSEMVDAKRLFHELQVHQIELELQNEELQHAKRDLQIANNSLEDQVANRSKKLSGTIAQLKEEIARRKQAEKQHGQYIAIIESSTDAIISKSLDGIVTSWNPAAERMFGYTAQEMLGKSLLQVIPPECVDEEQRILLRICDDEHIEHFETIRRRKNGENFPVSVTISPIKDSSGVVIGASKIARDISERKRSDAYRRMGQDILLALSETDSLSVAFEKVVGLVKHSTGVDAVGIRLQNGDDFPYFYQEGFPQEFLQTENSILTRTRDGGICRDAAGNVCLECTCGLVITGKTDPTNPLFTCGGSSWTNDSFPFLHVPLEDDPRTNPRNECIHQGFASVALIPIRAKGQIVGLLQLNDYQKGCFTLEGIETLEDIADNIGEALLRKQAEDELRNNKELILNLLQNTDQGIYGINMDGTCTFINNSALTMLSYEADECIGKNMHELIHHSHSNGVPYLVEECPIYKVKSSGKGCRITDEVLWRRDGSSFFTEYSTNPIIENGAICGAVVTFSDISARKQAEEEKINLESHLHQAQKMESIGSLAGGVAHDFNNKLSVILGCASLAAMESDPEKTPKYLDEICKAAEQSADLTRQLLAFARKQVIFPKVLDLNESVAGMLKMLNRLIGENIFLSWQPAADLWRIKFDPSQVDQILANLCVNARDAICGGGKIIIETANSIITEDNSAVLSDSTPGEYVKLIVSDNGCGMDNETVIRIFEPFFTTKEAGKGTGLGLSTVFGIVKQNNGFINVYSEPGVGTTFTIYLPRHSGSPSVQLNEGINSPTPVGHETILLVEDEQAILNIASVILSKQGYTVLQANSPAEAIRLAKENSGKINLLITDVIMPDMNGKDLANTIESIYPHVRCLFMSGYTADAISQHGVLEEGVSFIQKPFSLSELAVKVRQVLDGTE